MGIPKFFRWCAERYPTILCPITEDPPPIDNLYLDMNGIIHVCARSNATSTSTVQRSDESIAREVFSYLDRIFSFIQPKQYFFMAVDGVAPRAKMNQQRQRRYRKAMEMQEAGVDTTIGFDSNCITPGTTFMVALSRYLEYFIHYKIQNFPSWRKCKVVYSGHQDPGEGEHKIMSFIRTRKMQPGYSSHETHCMYGLDADLIMLALASHEPNFVLLREIVSFGTPKRERELQERDEKRGIVLDKRFDAPSKFVLLHIHLLREYLCLDLRPENLERCIDDFIFLCFFVGNDFLPALPSLDIGEGSLSLLFDVYKAECVRKNRYLTQQKSINWDVLEDMLRNLGSREWELLCKKRNSANKKRRGESESVEKTILDNASTLGQYKAEYYGKKLNTFTPIDHHYLRRSYVEGLQWIMEYYYEGCCSWGWYYPYHYSPLASDLVDLVSLSKEINFSSGEPFTPHQQLLAVLPPASYRSVPQTYWELMRSDVSLLKPFYPDLDKVVIDREGCRMPWEGVVCLPFLQESVLKEAYEQVVHALHDSEKKNNTRISARLYEYRLGESSETHIAPLRSMRDIRPCNVHGVEYQLQMCAPFNATLCDGVSVFDTPSEGFGTLSPLVKTVSTELRSSAVKVFLHVTRQPSLFLNVPYEASTSAREVSKILVGHDVFVGFPYLKRARVTSVCDVEISVLGTLNSRCILKHIQESEHSEEDMDLFEEQVEDIYRKLISKKGIDLASIRVLVYVRHVVGVKYTKNRTFEYEFSENTEKYPVQLVFNAEQYPCRPNPKYDIPNKVLGKVVSTLSEVIFVPHSGSTGIQSLFGCVGSVVQCNDVDSGVTYDLVLRDYESRCTESFSSLLTPTLEQHTPNVQWFSVSLVSTKLHAPIRVVLAVMGNISCNKFHGEMEIGLGMLNTKQKMARAGYTKYVSSSADDGALLDSAQKNFNSLSESTDSSSAKGEWYFTEAGIRILFEYWTRFKPLIDTLCNGRFDIFAFDPAHMMRGEWAGTDIFEALGKITSFLHTLPYREEAFVPACDELLTAKVLAAVEKAVISFNFKCRELPNVRRINVKHVKLSCLLIPRTESTAGIRVGDIPVQHRVRGVLERVVYCDTDGSVPFGSRGLIVRLLGDHKHAEVVMDEEHPGCVSAEGRLESNRAVILRQSALLVVTRYGTSKSSPEDTVQLKEKLQTLWMDTENDIQQNEKGAKVIKSDNATYKADFDVRGAVEKFLSVNLQNTEAVTQDEKIKQKSTDSGAENVSKKKILERPPSGSRAIAENRVKNRVELDTATYKADLDVRGAVEKLLSVNLKNNEAVTPEGKTTRKLTESGTEFVSKLKILGRPQSGSQGVVENRVNDRVEFDATAYKADLDVRGAVEKFLSVNLQNNEAETPEGRTTQKATDERTKVVLKKKILEKKGSQEVVENNVNDRVEFDGSVKALGRLTIKPPKKVSPIKKETLASFGFHEFVSVINKEKRDFTQSESIPTVESNPPQACLSLSIREANEIKKLRTDSILPQGGDTTQIGSSVSAAQPRDEFSSEKRISRKTVSACRECIFGDLCTISDGAHIERYHNDGWKPYLLRNSVSDL